VFKRMRRFWLDEEPDTVHEEVAPDKERAPRRTFKDIYPDEMSVALLEVENPKRKNTRAWERYEKYRGTETVGEALLMGIPYRDIDSDRTRGYIAVGGK
jgi:hypothetical protein